MGNHYHFLLVTPEAILVSGMRWFASSTSHGADSQSIGSNDLDRAIQSAASSEWGTSFKGATRRWWPIRKDEGTERLCILGVCLRLAMAQSKRAHRKERPPLCYQFTIRSRGSELPLGVA